MSKIDFATPDAALQLKIGKDKRIKTISYYIAFVALGLANASLGPTLPGLAANTNTVIAEISFLFTARSLGYLLGSLLGGRLYDRISGHRVLTITLLGLTAMLALTPTASLLWLLTVILLLLGVSEATLDVGGNTLLVWVHQDKVGPYMNALHFFFGIGAFLSPIIIAQAILRSDGIAWAYWVLAILILPIGLWFWQLPSPQIRTAPQDEPTARIDFALLGLMALFAFLYVGAEVSFGGWIFTYALTLEIAEEAAAAYLTSAFWGALTVGRLITIPLAVHFRPRTILLSNVMGCLVSVIIIALWPTSMAAVWLGTLGIGFSMAAIFPTMLSLAERNMHITGQVTSLFFVGASLGGMSIPFLIGRMFESMGPQVLTTALIITLIAALAIFGVMIAYINRKQALMQTASTN